jgi:hypothetical protein
MEPALARNEREQKGHAAMSVCTSKLPMFVFKNPGDSAEGWVLAAHPGEPPLLFLEQLGPQPKVLAIRCTPSLFIAVRSIPQGSRVQVTFTHEEANANGTKRKIFTVSHIPTNNTAPTSGKDNVCQPSSQSQDLR